MFTRLSSNSLFAFNFRAIEIYIAWNVVTQIYNNVLTKLTNAIATVELEWKHELVTSRPWPSNPKQKCTERTQLLWAHQEHTFAVMTLALQLATKNIFDIISSHQSLPWSWVFSGYTKPVTDIDYIVGDYFNSIFLPPWFSKHCRSKTCRRPTFIILKNRELQQSL